MELTERQERVLRAIVDQYIDTARPVGSAALVGTRGLDVSSATVRHEMAVLEEMGFLRHLHTSGGRVPTNLGYRYYVQNLMQPTHIPRAEARTIRHQFHQAHSELQEWLRLAATVMAHRMHNVGLITAPRSAELRFRHLEAISIQPSVALLIVVLQDGTVLQEMMALPDPYSQEQLSAMADQLSQMLRGMTAAQVEARVAGLPSLFTEVGMAAARLLGRAEGDHAQVFHAGLADMIRQPEFHALRPGEPPAARNERLRQMLEFLQQGFAIERLLAGLPPRSDLEIVIGGDTGSEGLDDYSFVLGRYGHEAESSGYLGIIGPTRMEYPRAVALVRYMTDLMTDLMSTY